MGMGYSTMATVHTLPSQKPSCFYDRMLIKTNELANHSPCSECAMTPSGKCIHFEGCSECTNYQIEKLLRCQNCCEAMLNQYPPSCSKDCSRKQKTNVPSAKCDLCGNYLKRRCTSCKSNTEYRKAKEEFKTRVRVFIIALSSVSTNPFKRPCSHCRLCTKCSLTLTKGHRERGICGKCKRSSPSQHSHKSAIVAPSSPTSLPSNTKSPQKSSPESPEPSLLKKRLPGFDSLIAGLPPPQKSTKLLPLSSPHCVQETTEHLPSIRSWCLFDFLLPVVDNRFR